MVAGTFMGICGAPGMDCCGYMPICMYCWFISFFASCFTFARLFWNQFCAQCQLSNAPTQGSGTDVDLVQGHAEVVGKALLGAGAGLVVLLEVALEDVMLLLGPVHELLVSGVPQRRHSNGLTDAVLRRRWAASPAGQRAWAGAWLPVQSAVVA